TLSVRLEPISSFQRGATANERGAMRSVGLVGAGAIGMAIIQAFEARRVPGYFLNAVLCRSHQMAGLRERGDDDVVITDAAAVFCAQAQDLVIEAAGHGAALAVGPSALERGCDLYLMSVGVLADAPARRALESAAAAGKAKIVIPSGAFAGFDGLRALAQ